MKKINICDITPPDMTSHYTKRRQYSIYLGNGKTVYFKNYRKAQAFMTETNRFLNNSVHELNYLYFSIFSEYRKGWFYFHSSVNQKVQNYQRKDNVIQGYINSINRAFDLSVTRSHLINGNYFTFKHLFNIIDNLYKIIEIIRFMLNDHKLYADLYRIEIFERQLNTLANNLKNYGVDPNVKNSGAGSNLKNFDISG